MREVPADVVKCGEWGRASFPLRVLYAEMRPRSGVSYGVPAPQETLAGLFFRVANSQKIPLFPDEAKALFEEGERLGFWASRERLVDDEERRERYLVVSAFPPSVLEQRRARDEAERGPRNGKGATERQRIHRAKEAQERYWIASLPGTEIPADWKPDGGGGGADGGRQVSDENVTAQPPGNTPSNRDAAPPAGAPPFSSGSLKGPQKEEGGAVAEVPDEGQRTAEELAALDDETRGALALARIGKESPAIFDARTDEGEVAELGRAVAALKVGEVELLNVGAWLKGEDEARRALLWWPSIKAGGPVAVSFLLMTSKKGKQRWVGLSSVLGLAKAWAAKRQKPLLTVVPTAPPGPAKSAGPEPFESLEALKARMNGG